MSILVVQFGLSEGAWVHTRPLVTQHADFVVVRSDSGFTARAVLNGESFAGASDAAPVILHFLADVTGGNAPYSYVWSFGDGSKNSSAENPAHPYAAFTTYQVRLVVTDSSSARAYSNITATTGYVTCTALELWYESPIVLGLVICTIALGGLAVGVIIWKRKDRKA